MLWCIAFLNRHILNIIGRGYPTNIYIYYMYYIVLHRILYTIIILTFSENCRSTNRPSFPHRNVPFFISLSLIIIYLANNEIMSSHRNSQPYKTKMSIGCVHT